MHRLRFLFLVLPSFLVLLACTPTPSASGQSWLYVYRFQPPALLELTEDFQHAGEIPFSLPHHCGLLAIFSAPVGRYLAIELSCPNGQTVLLLDTDMEAVIQPVREADSHFLAWMQNGEAAYLKVDSLGNPRIVRVSANGRPEPLAITGLTYDLAAAPDNSEFTFTFSGGLGQGSELHLAEGNGRVSRVLYADPSNYISFVRYSPDGSQIAFLKTPDTQTPFPAGELWVMNRDGSDARKLAQADAGHGYAANWSPDGTRIAFVVRENPLDERADQLSEALLSNLYIVAVESGEVTRVTSLEKGRVETPLWSPDGNTLAFNMVVDDRMNVQIADLKTGEIGSLPPELICCPAWIRK
jgi:dipeptidyl aminopeptidase/acylaminoacyl peptidase